MDVSLDSTIITTMEQQYINYNPNPPSPLSSVPGSPVQSLANALDPPESQANATGGFTEQEQEQSSPLISNHSMFIALSWCLIASPDPMFGPQTPLLFSLWLLKIIKHHYLCLKVRSSWFQSKSYHENFSGYAPLPPWLSQRLQNAARSWVLAVCMAFHIVPLT